MKVVKGSREVGVASGPHREPSDSLRKVETTYETAKK